MNRKPAVVGALLILAIPISFLIAHSLGIYEFTFPLKSPDFAQFMGAVGTLVLTVALATLYWEQTNIQDRQEMWMAAEHKPIPIVEEWTPDINFVDILLLNDGNGLARNFQLKIILEPDSVATPHWSDHAASSKVSLYRTGSTNSSLEPERDKPEKFTMDNVHKFNDLTAHGWERFNFLELTTRLIQQYNVKGATLKIILTYDYIAEKSGSRMVYSGFLHLSSPKTVEEAIIDSTPNEDEIEAPAPTW